MQEKLIDAEGNEVLMYSTSSPILRLIQPGTMAVSVTPEEFEERHAAHARSAKAYKNPNDPANMRKELDSLKEELKALKADKSPK